MKWTRISTFMIVFGQITHMKNKPTYKEKWATIYGDCKKNWDYMVGACHNEDYWNTTVEERVSWNL